MIPLGAITGMQFQPAGPMASGFIAFSLPESEGRLRLGRQSNAFARQTALAERDANAVLFAWAQNQQFTQFRDAVQSAMAAPAGPVDVPGQIQRLGELLKAGLLTEAEFVAKKTELLARM